MGSAAFDLVWQKIAELEGATFETSKGVPFQYRFHKTYVVVSTGSQSIPRTYFEKIFRRLEQSVVDCSPPVQGQSLILAILTDPRFKG